MLKYYNIKQVQCQAKKANSDLTPQYLMIDKCAL